MADRETKDPKELKKIVTGPLRLLLLTTFFIFTAELCVIYAIFSYLPPLPVFEETLIDSLLLTIPVFPLLYLFLFRPLLLNITYRKKAEEALERSYHNLEIRINERTAELANTVKALQAEIAERMGIEEALKKNRASLVEAQKIARLGNWDWDIVNNTLHWSDEIYRIFGIKPDEFGATYESFVNFVHPNDREFVKNAVNMALYAKRTYNIDHRIVRPDGTERIVHEQADIKFNEAGNPIYMIGTVQDVTDTRKMEAEFLKTHKLESIGLLAGGIAHDFNNILTVILGNISLAKGSLDSKDKLLKKLTAAEEAVERAQGLTRQLLTFSKGGTPVRETASIVELLRDSAGFALMGSMTRCEYIVNNDIWPVEIDVGQINQVIHNLIINAEHAMPEGGTITITIENIDIGIENALALKEGRYIKVSVKDRGTGISEENLPKIFDPYFTTKKAGSGLGLATSYSIIKKHGGLITVESELGNGATFYIYLPASDKKVTEKGKNSEETLLGGKGKVLVMDDEATIRELMLDLLNRLGYEAELAKDGSEAIEKYEGAKKSGRPFDAVIMDLTIPGGMGGKEAIKQLREIDPRIKAIVSSGYHNDPIMAEYERYGFKDVMAKPYTVKKLSEVLNKVIKS